MPSIRRKIQHGSFALVSIIALLALLFYSDLGYLERRIESGVAIYEFLDAVLEIRLEEKSFSLTSDVQNKQSALDFADRARDILQQHRHAFLALHSESELQALESLLLDYEAELSRYGGPPQGTGMQIGPASAVLLQLGERLTAIAKSLASAERSELGTSISRAKGALLASVVIVALLGIAAAHLLSRFSVRPLAWLESEVAAIGKGRYNQLKPVSQDQEIVSVSRAVNRMLDDIETRNQHLLQSEKLASLGTLASGVAHELNNPLSNISSSCQILMEEIEQQLPTDPMEWLGQIDKETERARLIVKSILDFSKENRVHKTNINLRELIGKSRLLLGQAGNSGFSLSAVPKD
jgi:signal transduction histidine kinase